MFVKSIKSRVRRILLGHDISTYYFGQSGEDAILQNIFAKKLSSGEKGFYVDVGAYHPFHKSNTYLLYINGWQGINIDARPGSMKLFDKYRSRDLNIETGISDKEGTLKYYFLGENSPMNSFSKENLERLGMKDKIKKEIPVAVTTLKNVLEKNLNGKQIDFLNIDAEGLDENILRSNDWKKFRPRVIAVELDVKTIQDVIANTTAQYLMSMNYEVAAKTFLLRDVATVIFIDKDFDN